jgi:hypothetical protein
MTEQTFTKDVNGKASLNTISQSNGVLGEIGMRGFYGKSHFEAMEHCIFTEEKLVSEGDPHFNFEFSVLQAIQVLEINQKKISKIELCRLINGFARIPSQSFRKLVFRTSKMTQLKVEILTMYLNSL